MGYQYLANLHNFYLSDRSML